VLDHVVGESLTAIIIWHSYWRTGQLH